jgi:hypothetical protein
MNLLDRSRPLFNDFRADIVRLWWTAGFFNLVLLVILSGYLAIAEQWKSPVLLGFAVIGSGGGWFFWRAVRDTLDYRRFGNVDIIPHNTVARPGGKLGVTLQFARQPPAITELESTLRCEARPYYHDPFKGVRLIGPIEAVWTESRRFVLASRSGSARCVAEFDLPADAKPSDLPRECYNDKHPPGDYEEHPPKDSIEINARRTFHAWRLTFTADVPGVDFQRTYRVNVAPVLDQE